MWACVRGHIDAAATLYRWHSGALQVGNKDGHMPLAVARQRGHYTLIQCMESLSTAVTNRILTPADQDTTTGATQSAHIMVC